MKYRIVKKDWKGRILFTEEELVDLLDSVYREGYVDALKTPTMLPTDLSTWNTSDFKITCEDAPDGFGKMTITTDDADATAF